MKQIIIIAVLLGCLSFGAYAEKGFDGRPITNNISMPTGFTLNRGEFIVGLGNIGFGISDRFQVGTNVLLYLVQDYNANVKYSLIKTEDKALSVGFKFHRFDLSVFGSDSTFTSFSPFASFSTKISQNTLLHLGAQYSSFSGDAEIEDAVVEEASEGTSVSLGIEHRFSSKTRFLAETGYDATFKGFRVGAAVLWGWKSFRLKLGGRYFKPKGIDEGFISPVISLWWRFKG